MQDKLQTFVSAAKKTFANYYPDAIINITRPGYNYDDSAFAISDKKNANIYQIFSPSNYWTGRNNLGDAIDKLCDDWQREVDYCNELTYSDDCSDGYTDDYFDDYPDAHSFDYDCYI